MCIRNYCRKDKILWNGSVKNLIVATLCEGALSHLMCHHIWHQGSCQKADTSKEAKNVYCSKIKPTDSGTSSKGRKGPSKKGVDVYICLYDWICKRVGSICCIILRLCLCAVLVQELEEFAALYWDTSAVFMPVLTYILTSFHTLPLVAEMTCLSLMTK